MNAIVLNHCASNVLQESVSVALRSAYLLCDKITAAGTVYCHIYFNVIEQRKTLEVKLDAIDLYSKAEGIQNDWSAAEVKRMLKVFRKMKHPAPEAIKLKKGLEKHINDLYQAYADEQRANLASTGMLQLQELFDTDRDMPMYNVQYDRHESEQNGCRAMSKLLKLEIENRERDADFFCLTWDFFLKRFDEANGLQVKEGGAGDLSMGWLQPCMRLPNVNLLSVKELGEIRTAVNESAAAFRQAGNEWINAVYAGMAADETAQMFSSSIAPAAETLSNVLEENSLLTHVRRLQNDAVNSTVMLGEIPVSVMWNFYRDMKVLRDETWDVMEKALQTDEFANKRYPVMALKISESIVPAELIAGPAEEVNNNIEPVKKSLAID
jgi:hypothetical protein